MMRNIIEITQVLWRYMLNLWCRGFRRKSKSGVAEHLRHNVF